MSGICGVIRFDEQAVEEEEIQNILDAMQNRGNDAEGIWVDNNVGFGHKMLWNTPESLHENQPLVSLNSKLIITADARIDNREELLNKLEINENDFSVITDTDLIVWSYEKWGEECPKYFLGDFVFAIFDKVKKKFFFAKDHIGIRPFFYYIDEQFFCFTSELSALFSIDSIKKQPNNYAIKNFLEDHSLRYEETFYQNIKRLSPAHWIMLEKDKIRVSKYWYPEQIKINKSISFKDASDKFKNLLEEAIKVRLRTAYSVGCELSGGLDSSSVACIASKIKLSKSITLFSQRYGGWTCDESYYSNLVGKSLNLDIQSVRVDQLDYKKEYSLDNYFGMFPDWPTYGSFMGLLPIANNAQEKNIRVLLTGQGGDHIVAGNLYMFADYLKTFQLKKLYVELKYRKWQKKIIKSYVIRPNLPGFIMKLRSVLTIKHRNYTKNKESKIENQSSSFAFNADLDYVSGTFNAFWNDSNIYHNIERFNIESRHPYFDIRLVEFCLSLPAEYKLKLGVSKRILREAMKGILPEPVRIRNDKAEFSKPVEIQSNIEYNEKELIYMKERVGYYPNIDKKNVLASSYLNGVVKWYKRNF